MAENKEEIKEKKISFFKKVFYSITKFEKYPEMAAEGMMRAFLYLAQIMLVFSVIVSMAIIYQLYTGLQKGIEYINNEFQEIYYSDGILDVKSNDAIIIETENLAIDKIIIDTNVENDEQINEYIESIPQDGVGIIALKDKILIKNRDSNEETVYKYSEIIESLLGKESISFNKQDMLNYITGNAIIPVFIMIFALTIVYTFIIYAISVALDALLIAVLGTITMLLTKLRLKFSAVYNMAVYSLTISILLNAIYITINIFTGFELKYFQIMYISIAYVCLVAALFMIRIDLVKKQAELMKIMEEQKKIREEMQEKEKEEEKEENKKPEDNDKDEDEGEKEDNTEPDGSSA